MGGKVLELRATPVKKAIDVLRQFFFTRDAPDIRGHNTPRRRQRRKIPAEIERRLAQSGVTLNGIEVAAPSLEDVFVTRLSGVVERPSISAEENGPAGPTAKMPGSGETALEITDLSRKFRQIYRG